MEDSSAMSNIIGFETYSVQSWLSECLTRHPQAIKESTQKKRPSSPSALMRVFSSLTACAALSSVSFATAAVSAPPPIGSATAATLMIPGQNIVELPSAFWSHAIADVRSWRPVKEQDVTDPPLLF